MNSMCRQPTEAVIFTLFTQCVFECLQPSELQSVNMLNGGRGVLITHSYPVIHPEAALTSPWDSFGGFDTFSTADTNQ